MNLMVVTDKNYLKHTYIMLYSFLTVHRDIPVDIYLPYEALDQGDIDELGRFLDTFGNASLTPMFVGDSFKSRVVSQSNIAVETYYRILAIEMLPADMDKILYMDVDLCVKGSMEEFYNTEMGENLFVVCDDIIGVLNDFYDENRMRLGIPMEYGYFNAGVMLFNLTELRRIGAAEQMLESIYENYERYLYNDQDVMNALYYDRLIFKGWDEYNCPPAWYYLNKKAMAEGRLEFAQYKYFKEFSEDIDRLNDYQNITQQIYDNARVIHYLGDLKPWSVTRENAKLFDIFDKAYRENEAAVNSMRQ